MAKAKRRTTKIQPKAVGGGIVGRYSNFDKCLSQSAGDFISSVAVEEVGTDVRATFGEAGLNSGRIIRFLDRRDPFYATLLCSI